MIKIINLLTGDFEYGGERYFIDQLKALVADTMGAVTYTRYPNPYRPDMGFMVMREATEDDVTETAAEMFILNNKDLWVKLET